jgi:AcrR family transcriptional regulator
MPSTKRDAICDAALALFAEQGIEATTTREIADRADAAEGTIYRHFRDKEELVEWLFDTSAQRFHDVLRDAAADRTDPRSRLRALVRGVFDFAEQHPTSFSYLLSVHHTGLLQHQTEPPPPMQLFLATLQAGTEQGFFRDLPPVLATGWIVAMAQRAVVFLKSDVMSASEANVREQTVDAVLRLVAADEAR